MENLTVLKEKIEKYRGLLSEAESQETIGRGLAEEIVKFEISFENKMNDNQSNLTELIEREENKIDKSHKNLNSYFNNFREDIESGKPIEDIIDKYSLRGFEYLELRLSNSIKQEELYTEYFELQIKRMDIDLKKGFKIHEVRYELDERYKQEIDYHRLMDRWERQARKVYETEPEGMYV